MLRSIGAVPAPKVKLDADRRCAALEMMFSLSNRASQPIGHLPGTTWRGSQKQEGSNGSPSAIVATPEGVRECGLRRSSPRGTSSWGAIGAGRGWCSSAQKRTGAPRSQPYSDAAVAGRSSRSPIASAKMRARPTRSRRRSGHSGALGGGSLRTARPFRIGGAYFVGVGVFYRSTLRSPAAHLPPSRRRRPNPLRGPRSCGAGYTLERSRAGGGR